jgi:hypothetical protein
MLKDTGIAGEEKREWLIPLTGENQEMITEPASIKEDAGCQRKGKRPERDQLP